MKYFLPSVCIVLSISIAYCLSSCRKSEDIPDLIPGVYIYERTGDYSGIQMFTRAGEITDVGVINTYKIKYARLIYPLQQSATKKDTFTVINPTVASTKYGTLNISRVSDLFEFKGTDTLMYFGNPDTTVYHTLKYKPYLLVKPLPFGSGKVKTFQYHYASSTGSNLIFPFLNYIRSSTTYYQGIPTRYSLYNSAYNNIFDEQGIIRLNPNDTLIIQTFNVYFQK